MELHLDRINTFQSILHKAAKVCLPPILFSVVRKILNNPQRCGGYIGDYPDWASAVAASKGYAAPEIFERVRNAARAVRDGQALWERDSVLFYAEEYNLPLVAALMSVAAWNGGTLSVLDFGGGLGSTYMQNRKLLDRLLRLSWNIVEQEHVVACGQAEFTTQVMHFFTSMESCLTDSAADVILFSSSLQYLKNSYELLEQALSHRPKAVILDRTPIGKHEDRITVQYVPKEIYPASYPCRLLEQKRIADLFQKHGYELTPWWQSPVDPPDFLGVLAYLT